MHDHDTLELAGSEHTSCEFQPGDLIDGHYKVLSWLGEGGMGAVYRVEHTIMHKVFALKVLSSNVISKVAWGRFQNEARAIARVQHPNIVGIANLGIHQGKQPYYVMDLLEGKNLAELLYKRGPMPIEPALSLILEVCAGLGYAHKHGIIHRDIKPANLLLLDQPEPHCRVKIVDFGIAKLAGGSPDQALTSKGEIFGSPLYISPEQTNGERADARSDIYSLGCTLFELLTGQPPLKGPNALATMMMHQTTPPPTLQEVGGQEFPEMLEDIVASLLAKAPKERYQNCELLAQDLRAVLAGEDRIIHPFFQGTGDNVALTLQTEDRDESFKKDALKRTAIIASAATLLIAAMVATGAAITGGNSAGKPSSARSTQATSKEKTALAENAFVRDQDLWQKASPAVVQKNDYGPDSLQDKTPFIQVVDEQGQKFKIVQLPSDINIGRVFNDQPKLTNSEGYGKFPAVGNLYFHPEPIVIQYPQYLSRFHKYDLTGLELDSDAADSKLLATALKIPALECITLYNCTKLKKEDLKLLTAMQTPTAINFGKCGFSPDDVADWPGLQKISRLACVGDPRSTDKLLKAITKPRQQMLTVYILDSSVSKKGFQYLSEQPRISNLYLSGSSFDKHNLSYLAGLRHLRTLSLGDTALDAETVAILQKFKHLEQVSFNLQNPKNLSLSTLKKALPGLEFRNATKFN